MILRFYWFNLISGAKVLPFCATFLHSSRERPIFNPASVLPATWAESVLLQCSEGYRFVVASPITLITSTATVATVATMVRIFIAVSIFLYASYIRDTCGFIGLI